MTEGPWLTVIGVGEDGLAGLSPAARAVVETAEVLVGGERHLAMAPGCHREKLPWRSPLADTLPEIEARRGRRVVVLATGDPMCFGVGETLCRRFGAGSVRVVPAPSAFSLICARLGWSLPEVERLSLHGRAPHLLLRFTAPGAKLIVLSHDGQTPSVIAEMLRERGYGPSRIWAFEHLGGEGERRIEGRADSWPAGRIADLNTVAVACEPEPDATLLPRVPGLPDEAFRNDGKLTKREVRAATLARLMPFPGQVMWDVGAGCGSIGIEWLRAAGRGRVVAVERDPARCATIAGNADALGTPELEVLFGTAPGCLAGLDPPDAVFVGGGLWGEPRVLDACWDALKQGGRLVANAVTAEGEIALLGWHKRFGGELTRISVARGERMGGFTGWRALAPVTMLAAQKP